MLKDQPRVALYLRALYGGGAERALVNLARGLVEQGIAVDFLLNEVGGAYQDQVPPEVRIVDLNTQRTLQVGLPRLVRYLRRERPVALLSALHYNVEIALWAKYLAGVPTRVVVCEQNTLSINVNSEVSRNERLSPLLTRLFYRFADGIVAVSQGVAQDLSQVAGLPRERIQVIHNPAVTPELAARAQEPVEHPWFETGQPPVILGVGRLADQKDFPTLIRAFAQVHQQRSARLMILGEGKQRKQLLALARELKVEAAVALPGFVANPYAYMARAAALVLSSAWEGLPTVLIEAMAVGTPVVSTDCPSGAAEILDQGKYGWLVPVGDHAAIAVALLKILAGEVKPVDPGWLRQFSLEDSTQRYLELFGIPQVSPS